jgi:hypothetical protein
MDVAQRSQHIKSFIETCEKNMEYSLAVQCRKKVVCGICMEMIYTKANPSECCFRISPTVTTPTISSVFTIRRVLRNLKARSLSPAQNTRSHLILSFQVSTKWRRKKKSIKSFRNTRKQ